MQGSLSGIDTGLFVGEGSERYNIAQSTGFKITLKGVIMCRDKNKQKTIKTPKTSPNAVPRQMPPHILGDS